MPVKWLTKIETAPASPGAFSHEAGAAPRAQAQLWPHRSLSRRGFVVFIGATFAMILLPLIPLLGTPVLWGLLPFLMGALWAMYYFLQRSYRDADLAETLTLWADHIALERHNPRSPDQSWAANPHWVQVEIAPDGGPVPQYLTLRGAGRTVELGAFLAPEERVTLYGELRALLRAQS